MRERLRRWIVSRQPSALTQAALAILALALAVAARLGLMTLVGGSLPFLTFFPAILIVTVFTGRVGAAVGLIGGVALGVVFAPQFGRLSVEWSRVVAAVLMAGFGGFITYVALTLREVLREAYARREQEHLLLLEIQHRVKNSLAVVQSLATQTLGRSRSPEAEKFLERLLALGEVQNLLSSSGWRAISMRTLAERALKPFRPHIAERLVIDGDDLELASDHAVSLALALHELATNALKYGALSNEAGCVELRWATQGPSTHPRLKVSWVERGGPAATPPKRGGFGSRLLQRDFGGSTPASPTLEFRPEGVAWSVELPLKDAASARAPASPKSSTFPAPWR